MAKQFAGRVKNILFYFSVAKKNLLLSQKNDNMSSKQKTLPSLFFVLVFGVFYLFVLCFFFALVSSKGVTPVVWNSCFWNLGMGHKSFMWIYDFNVMIMVIRDICNNKTWYKINNHELKFDNIQESRLEKLLTLEVSDDNFWTSETVNERRIWESVTFMIMWKLNSLPKISW